MTDRDTYTDPEPLLWIGEAAKILGVSIETLRRWDRAGKLNSIRTPGGQRRFALSEIERVRRGEVAA